MPDPSPLVAVHRSAGATVDPSGRPVRYGPVAAAYRASHDAATLVDHADIAIIDMTGADVRRWANGMFTQNFRSLAIGQVVESGWCDDRGRLQGLLYAAFVGENHLRVLVQNMDPEAFIEHFDRYVLVDDVEFVDRSNELHVLTVYGPRATALLGQVGLHASGGATVAESGSSQLWGTERANVTSVDVVVPRTEAVAVWSALVKAGAFAMGEDTERVLRVEAGRVSMAQDVPAKALAHELGLRDRILAFDKGCYVGQETVNRLDVRGQARKHLAGVVAAAPMAEGAAVEVDGVSVGTVSSVAHSPKLGWIALAVVRRPHDEGADAVVDGVAVRVRPLPLSEPVAPAQ